MGKYVIEINEKTNNGRALKTMLRNNPSLKMTNIERYETAEVKIIANEIRKAKKTKLLSYEEGKAEFRRLRRRLKK